MNTEHALNIINKEISYAKSIPALKSQEVINHYTDLEGIIKRRDTSNLTKVLVFQPIACGDLVCSSLCAELFHKKFLNCQVDYLTETPESISILRNNPFISNIIMTRNWEDYFKHQKAYQHSYSLYWWTPPMMKSFLTDLELPTDYLRLRVYGDEIRAEKAINFWNELDETKQKFRIIIQHKMALKWNYEKHGADLENRVNSIPNTIVVHLGLETHALCRESYAQTAEIMRQADMVICSHGSMEHIAAAVGTQTIALSQVYNPEFVSPAYIQNDYRPNTAPCMVVRPTNWCGDYHCVNQNIRPQHYPPEKYFKKGHQMPFMKPCDYNNLEQNCIYNISTDCIMNAVHKALQLRGLQ